MRELSISSSAFSHKGMIPEKSKSLALIVDDPDAPLSLQAGATKAQLEQAMKGHIIAQAELVGLYRRK